MALSPVSASAPQPSFAMNAPHGPAAQTQAVFIDKDGTLIHDVPYNVDAARIRLREDAAAALHVLQESGYALILVSNQPGVARGLFAEEALNAVWRHLRAELGRHGVRLAGIYYCPHHPQGSHPYYAHACTCRKPQPGMLMRAAVEHGIDLGRSWMIGDILDDVEAGHRTGCRSVLLDVGSETEWRAGPLRRPDFAAPSLTAAAAHILSATNRVALS